MIRFEKHNKLSFKNIIDMSCEKFDLFAVRRLLEQNQCVRVVMRDQYFYCYQEYDPAYINIDFALSQLNTLDNLSLKQLWGSSAKNILFMGCNEWVFQLFYLLGREKIGVRVEGEVWRIINGDFELIENENKEKRVNANLEKAELYSEFSFVMEILQYNRWKVIAEAKRYYSNLGANIFICTIPEFEDLKTVTWEETYRHERQMAITNGSLNILDNEVIANFDKIYGENWREIRKQCTTEPKRHWLGTVYETEYYLKNKKIYSYGFHRCYLIGPCIVEGRTSMTGGSFPELLQKCLDMNMSEKYAVMTISVPFYVVQDYLKIIKYLSVRSNDIIICIDEVSQSNIQVYSKYNDMKPDIDLKDFFDLRREGELWFADKPIHTSAVANKKLAEYLIERIGKFERKKNNCILQYGRGYLLEKEVDVLDNYLKSIDQFSEIKEEETIGAIVMNCNPLTLGHEYLIDCARKKVDKLYIFVVQEDRSYISFKDRIHLVRQYVKNWKNIIVNPSGVLMLSSITMPIYFEKEQRKDEIVDAWKDIEIFAQYIAPRLNISIRFVGEEKTDKVTYQYNREMERTLNDYGIKVQEIPRKELNEVAISASYVRESIVHSRWEKVRKLVSEYTYQYLLGKYVRGDVIQGEKSNE